MLTVPAKRLAQVDQKEEINRLYDSIPILSYSEIKEAAQMLYRLSNYIVEEAMNKNLILEAYKKIAPLKEKAAMDDVATGYSLDNIQHIKKNWQIRLRALM